MFFKKHTPIKIFKPRLVETLYHKNVNSSSKKHIFEPQKRFGQSDFKAAFVELSLGFELIGSKQPPPVMVTGALTNWKTYGIIMLQT